jgi:tRNA-splicing ligase RtcB (3'-phosphate/5'-hydroxy nucleic acid ligase)
MPDGHAGYGMPIGGVLATKGYIIPNAVGVDIGCGMASYKTNWKASNLSVGQIKKILSEIRKEVPVGFNRHKKPVDVKYMPDDGKGVNYNDCPVIHDHYDSAIHSLGTLGGGNHFIELQKDDSDSVYVMIHSGSRNLGKQICDHYNKLAKDLNNLYISQIPSNWDLAFLPVDSKEGELYIREMEYAVEFAKRNREYMMINVLKSMNSVLSGIEIDPSRILDVAHNYARLEGHFGSNVWVHRKGATSAREGELGVIPGSQGSNSYIVRGKGNKDSFMSCSHGAGRAMGRKEAIRTLKMDDELKRLEGIVHTVRSKKQLDESIGSYKDIKEVMSAQSDLVDTVTELKPLACLKG